MSTLTFDTYEHVKKLKAVGFTEAQAEAQTSLVVDLIDTKVVAREFLDSRLKDIQLEIVAVKADIILLKWMMGLMMGGIVALILKAFFPV